MSKKRKRLTDEQRWVRSEAKAQRDQLRARPKKKAQQYPPRVSITRKLRLKPGAPKARLVSARNAEKLAANKLPRAQAQKSFRSIRRKGERITKRVWYFDGVDGEPQVEALLRRIRKTRKNTRNRVVVGIGEGRTVDWIGTPTADPTTTYLNLFNLHGRYQAFFERDDKRRIWFEIESTSTEKIKHRKPKKGKKPNASKKRNFKVPRVREPVRKHVSRKKRLSARPKKLLSAKPHTQSRGTPTSKVNRRVSLLPRIRGKKVRK